MQSDQVATPQLAVEAQIEKREIADTLAHLKMHAYLCPPVGAALGSKINEHKLFDKSTQLDAFLEKCRTYI
ncbi:MULTISPECIES: hypothetical protein [unclassified Variovorax]|uniref:hypothetical protein n=1 Tax=Variovorax sp. Sphag1AA TaxID=2587027 RepID=UPI00160E079A|nr:hypothetical protein [Variovorax sp. Sphag1AA]